MRKKNFIKRISILIVVIIICIIIFLEYKLHSLNKLSTMDFNDIMIYTTKNNKDAKITVEIIENGKSSYNIYGENGTILSQTQYTYEIGSITKTFTSTLISKAIKENKLSLNDTIDMYLELPQKSNYPTIKSLLTHTSGYKSYYFETSMINNFLQKITIFME